MLVASQVVLVKNLPANTGDIIDAVSTPGFSEDLPRGGHGNSLQYSCLEKPTEELGELRSIRSHGVRHDGNDLARSKENT